MNQQRGPDSIASFIKPATGVLFSTDPVMTSLGGLFGFLLSVLIRILKPLLAGFTVHLSQVEQWEFVVLGVFIFNLIAYFRRSRLSQSVNEALTMIRIARKEGRLTSEQAKLLYVSLAKKVIQNVKLEPKTEGQVRVVEEVPRQNPLQ